MSPLRRHALAAALAAHVVLLLAAAHADAPLVLRRNSPALRRLGRGPGWWCVGAVVSFDWGGRDASLCARTTAACEAIERGWPAATEPVGCRAHEGSAWCLAHRRAGGGVGVYCSRTLEDCHSVADAARERGGPGSVSACIEVP